MRDHMKLQLLTKRNFCTLHNLLDVPQLPGIFVAELNLTQRVLLLVRTRGGAFDAFATHFVLLVLGFVKVPSVK